MKEHFDIEIDNYEKVLLMTFNLSKTNITYAKMTNQVVTLQNLAI